MLVVEQNSLDWQQVAFRDLVGLAVVFAQREGHVVLPLLFVVGGLGVLEVEFGRLHSSQVVAVIVVVLERALLQVAFILVQISIIIIRVSIVSVVLLALLLVLEHERPLALRLLDRRLAFRGELKQFGL